MQAKDVVIRCEYGLHLRVAAEVAAVARDHEASVQILCDGCRHANACSVMELLTLGAGPGTALGIVAEGPDENSVIDAIADVFEQGSGI